MGGMCSKGMIKVDEPHELAPAEPQEETFIDKEELLNEIKKYIDDRIDKGQENNRSLKAETDHYKEEYEKLYQKHEALIQEMSLHSTRSKISEKAIDAFVKTMMDDPKTNIRGFPDSIESALYKKALKTIMYAFAHTADVTSLRFMGHKISITIEPEEESTSSSTFVVETMTI